MADFFFGRLKSEEPEIVPDAHRAKANVDIGEANPEETQPRPKHVALIEAADAVVAGRAGGRFDLDPKSRRPDGAANDSRRCNRRAGKRSRSASASDAEAEMFRSRDVEPEGPPGVVGEDEDEDHRQIEEVAVDNFGGQAGGNVRQDRSCAVRRRRKRPGRARTPCNKRRDSNNR